MFAIRCLTSGEYIKVDYESAYKIRFHGGKIPSEILNSIDFSTTNLSTLYHNPSTTDTLKFLTKEAAQWFANRRLTYNPRRQDESKLSLMESIFKCNDLPNVTVKVEFEVVEI